MNRLLLFAAGLSCALTGVAHAAPYWVAYEGDDFPEDAGWHRTAFGGGAERTLEAGVLRLDSLGSTEIVDAYQIDREIDPESGELFVAEWSVRIAANLNHRDSGVVIAPDGGGTLSLEYTFDQLVSQREGWSIPIVPLEFHTYRIESLDMENYSLWIDGAFARNGEWDLFSLNRSFFAFGDTTQFGGTGSVTEWDYVRFGVIPEPPSYLCLTLLLACTFQRRTT